MQIRLAKSIKAGTAHATCTYMPPTSSISWKPDRPLALSDFKADPNPAAFEDAYCAIRYRPTWTVFSEQCPTCMGSDSACDNDSPDRGAQPHILFAIRDFDICTEFHPMLSWARPACSDAHLKHQQGHFDLGEKVMRGMIQDMRDSLCKKRYSTRGKNEDQRKQFAKEDSARIIEPLVKSLYDEFEKKEAEYDSCTRHGCDAHAQSEYDKTFESMHVQI